MKKACKAMETELAAMRERLVEKSKAVTELEQLQNQCREQQQIMISTQEESVRGYKEQLDKIAEIGSDDSQNGSRRKPVKGKK